MELSIRDAKARFAEAANAAAAGEQVVITKHGVPFVEIVAVKASRGTNWERGAERRRQLGLENHGLSLPDNFDDPAFSRKVLGLED